MKFPNKYLRNLKPYKLASHKIWSVEPEERNNILKLDWNEASVPPSPKVRERVEKILKEPCFFNLYPTTYNDELMTLLSEYVELPKENLQYFASSDALHEYICKVFISVGDPVIILGPSYDNFRLTCQANGAEVFFTYYNDDFTFSAEKFEADINRVEPAVVNICNPNNPTGNVHQQLYIEHLLNEFPDTLFLLDGHDYVRRYMTTRNHCANASAALFKKSVYYNIDKGFTAYKAGGDMLFWIEIAEKGHVAIVNQRLNYFRQHQAKVTTNRSRQGVNSREYKKTYEYVCRHFSFSQKRMELMRTHEHYIIMKNDYVSEEVRRELLDFWELPHVIKSWQWMKHKLIEVLQNRFSVFI